MTLLRYLDVMSCWKKGLGSPRGPTIWTDAASVANPASCPIPISDYMNRRNNHAMQSHARMQISMSVSGTPRGSPSPQLLPRPP